MYRLIESIKIKDGRLLNLSYHNNRMNEARRELFNSQIAINLADWIKPESKKGLVKCRVIYDYEIRKIAYLPYAFPVINSLKLVFDDAISYSYKAENRKKLKELYAQRGNADDILIVKNGEVTDSYFCNLVFKKAGVFYTPSSYLLKGTKRQQLIEKGSIRETAIRVEEISGFDKIYLINAMIDLEDNISVEMSKVLF